ncbi:MAG: CPXCG motif-containing cysteine-rich protein [Planctomycetota bacterium]
MLLVFDDEEKDDDIEASFNVDDDASYTCPACGEVIVIPVDRSAGDTQEYVEDCPVCCRPNVIRVEWAGDDLYVDARGE